MIKQVVGQRAFGLITSVIGAPVLGAVGSATRDLSVGTTVAIADEVRTGPDDTLEILWGRRALILVRPQSKVLIQESNAGQTEISLSDGSVRVTLAYAGSSTDTVTVQTPSSRIYTRGGVFEVDVRPAPPSLIFRVASAFSKAEPPIGQAPVETVRVLEGQSGIESLTTTNPGDSHMLESGVQARITAGLVEQVVELPKNSAKGVGLTDTDRQQGAPASLTQRLVNVHITHAVEVARLMSTPGPVGDQAATATGSDLNGTIVATSLSVPTIPPAQSGTTNGPAPGRQPSNPVAPAPSPGVTSPVPTLPPVAIPPVAKPVPNPRGSNRHVLKEGFDDDDKRGGKHNYKGNDRDQEYSDRVTSPIPMLPAVPASTMPTRASGQSRGVNNRDILKDAFDDDDKGGGRHKHKGNDRDQDYSGPVTSPLPTLPAAQVSTMTTWGPGHLRGVNNRDILKDAFDDDDKGGGMHKHKGNDRDQDYSSLVTSPLPTLPAIQVPTITTLAPGQSGGNNSRDFLKEILDDDNRGGGRKGRDRDKDD